MPEQTPRSLNHFALYRFTPRYYESEIANRREAVQAWLAGMRQAAPAVFLYQAYPLMAGADILVWSAL
ncbi:MAG TPA: hypothetical protein VLS48_08710, partial [Anaerolineales bacterium]|nr:hypothetical protein [Anaerolineales bacterium]